MYLRYDDSIKNAAEYGNSSAAKNVPGNQFVSSDDLTRQNFQTNRGQNYFQQKPQAQQQYPHQEKKPQSPPGSNPQNLQNPHRGNHPVPPHYRHPMQPTPPNPPLQPNVPPPLPHGPNVSPPPLPRPPQSPPLSHRPNMPPPPSPKPPYPQPPPPPPPPRPHKKDDCEKDCGGFSFLKFLPPGIYDPKTHKFFGILSGEDILIIGVILIVMERNDKNDMFLILALFYVLLSDYIDFGNILC